MKFDWIFFDCFNTLIDDFDSSGDETGIKPISHIPVKHGLYENSQDFHIDYIQWRLNYWSKGNHDEVLLPDRIHQVLQSRATENSQSPIDRNGIVEEMMHAFHTEYPGTVRKSPDIESILVSFHGKIKMGVVSNFFLPDFPEKLLRQHDLHKYFDFIIDSAQIKVKKPGKEIYQQALDLAKVGEKDRSRVLFVGDNFKNDVMTPRELGMHAVHYDRSDILLKRKQQVVSGPSFKYWNQFEEFITP